MNKKKNIFKKMLIISLCLMLWLGVSVFIQAAEEQKIHFGAVVPLTGALSATGVDAFKAAQLAVDDINSVGGILGRELKLYSEDSKTNVEEGIKAAKKLILTNKTIAIYGPTSDVLIGMMDFCEQNKVPLVGAVSGSTRLDKIGGKYQYRTCPSDSYEGVVDAEFAYNELGLKKVSLITLNGEGTLSVAEGFKDTYLKMGGEILNDIIVNPGQATYMSSIRATFEQNPEGVLLSADINVTATIIKEWRRAGYGGIIMCGTDIDDSPKFVDLAGKDNLGGVYYTMIASDPDQVPYRIFEMKALTSIGRVAYGAPHSYDAITILALAAQAAGEATGEAIAENMRRVSNPPGVKVSNFAEGKAYLEMGEEINYEGASGACDFDEYGNVPGAFAKYVFDSNAKGNLVKFYPTGSIVIE